MLNKQKEITNFNHRSSLPKQMPPQQKSISTRCISVSKASQNNIPFLPKSVAPPKQLTVPTHPFSITSAKEITKALSDAFSRAGRLGLNRKTALPLF